MMEYFSKLNQKLSWSGWVLMVLLLVGIFVRTYHFHDWLRFNADQSRDATVVSSFIEGRSSLPLLGPKAGGTNFKLGPIFYYFQIGAAKVFGDAPDVMAYPDLFLSILAIPLLFLFLQKYFDRRTALLLTAVFAVSLYAVKYSRFAWNPNSLPFWSTLFLYVMHEIATAPGRIKKRWIILAGLAVGVGVQLHTLTLIFFPVVTLGTFGLLLYRKKPVWKALLVVFCVAVVLNTGQIVSEVQTRGENISAFFKGVGTKQTKESGPLSNIEKEIVCYTEGNVYMLSSYNPSDTCELKSVSDKSSHTIIFLLGLIFFVGGFALSVRAFRKEEEVGKKYFLGLFLFYFALSFAVLFPLANEISMRFFLVFAAMPFVLLGLWFEYFSENFPQFGIPAMGAVAVCLIASNGIAVRQTFVEYASYIEGSEAGMDNVTLQEVERAAQYIVVHAHGAQTVSLDGDAKYLFKASKSIQYFTEKQGIKIVQKGKKTAPGMTAFVVENSKQKDAVLQSHPTMSDYAVIGRFTIFSAP